MTKPRTPADLRARLESIQQSIHTVPAGAEGYIIGQLTVLLWALGEYTTWHDAHIAGAEMWDVGRLLAADTPTERRTNAVEPSKEDVES